MFKKTISMIMAILLSAYPCLNEDIVSGAEETKETNYGDVNNDGSINLLDMIQMKSYLAENNTSNFNVKTADVDDDGEVTTDDASELTMYFTNQTQMFSYVLNIDTDKDGLCDEIEKEIGSNYLLPDTDEDGLTDYEEVYLTATDPLKKDELTDSIKDLDGDGLTNSEELALESNPQNNDTDQDGINDYEEVMTYKTDPNDKDSDHDGISDGGEIILKSDPLKCDSDQTYNQELAEDSSVFSEINTADSPYSLSISADAGGYIGESLKASISKYSDFLSEDEIIGNIVDLDYQDDFALNTLNVCFNLKNINDPENYMIFKYNIDANMLLPVETIYDGNKLILNDTEDGTYCVANIADMAENYNLLSESNVTEQNNYGAVYDSATNKHSINITYEMILDNSTCSMKSWDEISKALVESTEKLEKNNYICNLKLVFTAYGYSVDISCDNSERLKVICDTANEFFADPNVNSINSAYYYYANMKANSGNDVWNDLSTYYSAVNVKSISLTPRFVFNSNSNIIGHNCGFTIGSSFCNVFSKEILMYNKMFRNVVSNNKSQSAADKIYSVLTYSNVIKTLIPYRNSLFGKTLLNAVLSANSTADTDGDGKSDFLEYDLSSQKKLKEIAAKATIFSKGLSQWQSNTKVNISEEVITPMKSDPTKEDSDDDGIVDAQDAKPLTKFDDRFDLSESNFINVTNSTIYQLQEYADSIYNTRTEEDDGVPQYWLDGIKARAAVDVVSALLFPNSAKFIAHFLGNTGNTLWYNASPIVKHTDNGKHHYAENMNSVRELCETTVLDELCFMSDYNACFQGATFSDQGGNRRTPVDWWFSIGNAQAAMSIRCKKEGNTYTAEVEYDILDFYDWDEGSTKIGGLVIDGEMYLLHVHGMAREMQTIGTYKTTMTWQTGERLSTKK